MLFLTSTVTILLSAEYFTVLDWNITIFRITDLFYIQVQRHNKSIGSVCTRFKKKIFV